MNGDSGDGARITPGIVNQASSASTTSTASSALSGQVSIPFYPSPGPSYIIRLLHETYWHMMGRARLLVFTFCPGDEKPSASDDFHLLRRKSSTLPVLGL